MKSYSTLRKHIRFYRFRRFMARHLAWFTVLMAWIDRHTKHLQRMFRWIHRHTAWLRRALRWVGRRLLVLRYLNPLRYIRRIDWYIIRKFIGTYIFSIALIISISIVFDINENLAKFTQYHAPLQAIIFDYYANFIPYFSNLFSALFVFIAVIFFTSKMAGNSEIIAMMATGISFKRFLRPYMISCILISSLSYYLASEVIPHGTVIMQNFNSLYRNNKKNTSAENVQLQVGKGVIAYIQHYDNNMKKGYGLCLDSFSNKKLVSHLTAMEAQYDTVSDSKYHWKLTNWKLRKLQGLREHITSGSEKDSVIMMEPTDLVYSKGQQETFTSPELKDYITKQIDRGSSNVVQYQVEYHKRIASSFASFILTIIGASLSARKRKGGMGLYLGIGLALSFAYIMLQTVSATFAINANFPPMLAAWMPNILFAIIAFVCYRHAPN
jgi:lipopolysaccharide export system permease protein